MKVTSTVKFYAMFMFCAVMPNSVVLASDHGQNASAMLTEYQQKSHQWTHQIRIEKLRTMFAEAEIGAAQNDTLAMAIAGVMLQTDQKVGNQIVIPMNRDRAFRLLKSAYETGEIEAAYGLVTAYKNGWGTSQDSAYALNLVNEAILKGCTDCAGLQKQLQDIANKGQFSTKTYEGGPVPGRIANYDILGIRVNTPYSEAVQIVRNNGYFCESLSTAPTFSGQVQEEVNKRFPTRFQFVQKIAVSHRCKKVEAGTIELQHISTPKGIKLYSITMQFDAKTTDKSTIKQRIVAKYGTANSDNGFQLGWCDEYGVNTCYSPFMNYRYNGSMTLTLSLPISMAKDVQKMLSAEIEKTAPKGPGTNF